MRKAIHAVFALAVLLLPALMPASAQITVQGKQCNSKLTSCTAKCPPLVKRTASGKWVSDKEGSKCRSKCQLAASQCNSARPPAAPAGPACRTSRDCTPQRDGSPVLCVNNQCVVT